MTGMPSACTRASWSTASSRGPARSSARQIVVGAVGAVGVAAVLAAVLARHRAEFATALHAAPLGVLLVAAMLQLVALVARSGAWWICVDAAGGTVARRPLFRAASMATWAASSTRSSARPRESPP
jgi:uncharacterized membrane protein YbhN (UPF0104 family)